MKILMIEDNVAFVETFKYLMERFDITAVDTLGQAKALLSGPHCFGLILVDLGLPDSHGLNTLRALQSYSVPKVVLTGSYDVTGEWAKLGAIDFVTKTGDAGTLIERVMFNICKVEKKSRLRFSDKVFHEIRACFERAPVGQLELTEAM